MNISRESQTILQEFNSFRSKPQVPRQTHSQLQGSANRQLKDFCNQSSIPIWPYSQKQHYIHSSKSNDNYMCGCGFATAVPSDMKDHIVSRHKGRCIIGSTHYLSPFAKKLMLCQKKIQKASTIGKKTTQFFWKGFVLIKNTQFQCRKGNFYCGQCEICFFKAPDFVQHCLNTCGELQNSNSSHKIYTEEDWKKQNHGDQILDTNSKPLQESNRPIFHKETEIIQISSRQMDSQHICEESDLSKADFHNLLYKFTQEAINLSNFRILSQRRGNNPYRNYFYDYQNDNYMILVNPSKQITSQSFKDIKCCACSKVFISLYLFKTHVIEEKCHQSLESTFYLLYKRLFLGRYRKRIFKHGFSSLSIENFSSKVDPELFYEKLNFDQQISGSMRDFFLKNKGFIKLYCGEIWTQLGKPFECKSCKMTSYSPLKLFRHYETKCRSLNAFILVMFKKRGHLNKYKLLSLANNFLAKQPFYCLCNPSQVLTKFQFVSHVIDFHDRYIELELFLNK